jgi:hypothetical protein
LRQPVAQHQRRVHLLVQGLDPASVDTHERVEVRGRVEVVGQDAVPLGGPEAAVRHLARRPEVAQRLEDAIERMRVARAHLDPREGRLVVGAPDAELLDLELAALLHHAVEHAPHDVGVDQVSFERDRVGDHARPPGRCARAAAA